MRIKSIQGWATNFVWGSYLHKWLTLNRRKVIAQYQKANAELNEVLSIYKQFKSRWFTQVMLWRAGHVNISGLWRYWWSIARTESEQNISWYSNSALFVFRLTRVVSYANISNSRGIRIAYHTILQQRAQPLFIVRGVVTNGSHHQPVLTVLTRWAH